MTGHCTQTFHHHIEAKVCVSSHAVWTSRNICERAVGVQVVSRVCQLCSAWYASGCGSVVHVVLQRQTRALSQDDIMHRPAANHLDNALDHVLAEFDEAPFVGEDVCGTA